MNQLTQKSGAELPSVVISLDFELRWGVHDRFALDMNGYRENLENVQLVIPALLKLFTQREIRVTWACVGAIGCNNWQEYFSRAPAPPNYEKTSLKIDPRYADLDPEGRLYFAPKLVRLINECQGQELGTHTFSHIYACEKGICREDIRADLLAVKLLCEEKFGFQPVSLVFPRNQHGFLPVIKEAGIDIWRGNESPWYHANTISNSRVGSVLSRAFRFKDAVNPFMKRSEILHENMTRASLFLRTNLSELLWKLHFARIKYELDSLQAGQIFHIWCHPHNFGADMGKRLSRMGEVMDLVAEKCRQGQVVSRNMSDLLNNRQ